MTNIIRLLFLACYLFPMVDSDLLETAKQNSVALNADINGVTTDWQFTHVAHSELGIRHIRDSADDSGSPFVLELHSQLGLKKIESIITAQAAVTPVALTALTLGIAPDIERLEMVSGDDDVSGDPDWPNNLRSNAFDETDSIRAGGCSATSSHGLTIMDHPLTVNMTPAAAVKSSTNTTFHSSSAKAESVTSVAQNTLTVGRHITFRTQETTQMMDCRLSVLGKQ